MLRDAHPICKVSDTLDALAFNFHSVENGYLGRRGLAGAREN